MSRQIRKENGEEEKEKRHKELNSRNVAKLQSENEDRNSSQVDEKEMTTSVTKQKNNKSENKKRRTIIIEDIGTDEEDQHLSKQDA